MRLTICLTAALALCACSKQQATLKEFVIVIEDTTATAKQGVLYLDDVRFTRSAPGS